MKRLSLFFGILFVLCAQTFAQVVDIAGISVEPKFIKSTPGTEVTINMSLLINRNANAKEKIYLVAVLSKDEVWGNDGDLSIDLTGSREPVPYDNISQNNAYELPNARITDGTETYSFKFKIPNDPSFAHGEKWNLIVKIAYDSPNNPILGQYPYNYKDKKGTNKSQAWITPIPDMLDNATLSQLNALSPGLGKPNAVTQLGVKTKIIAIEIADNKESIFNTAFVNEKSARAELVIIKPVPTLDITATPGNTTFKGGDFPTVELKALDPNKVDVTNNSKVVIEYSIVDATGKTILPTQTYDPSKPIKLELKYFENGNNSVIIKAKAISLSPDTWESSPNREWTYTRDLPKISIVPKNYDLESLKDDDGYIKFDTKKFGWGTSSGLYVPKQENVKFKLMDGQTEIPITANDKLKYQINGGNWIDYDVNNGITIDQKWTELKIILGSVNYIADQVEFTFVNEMPPVDVNLMLVPQNRYAKHPKQYCGEEQTVLIEFDTTKNTLKYWQSEDDGGVDSVYLATKVAETKTMPIIKLTGGATSYFVSVIVSDSTGESKYKVWELVPHCLPEVTVLSEGNKTDFKDNLKITASVTPKDDDKKDEWTNLIIYYTTDGSVPSAANNDGNLKDGGSLTIKKTTTLKFTAWADDRLPSSVCKTPQEHKYQRLASGINAWYYDTKGQGNITKVVIHTTIAIDTVPDKIELISPTGKKTITVLKGEIKKIDDTTIVIEKDVIFSFKEIDNKTDFTPDPKELGKLFGVQYSDDWVKIGDSIAPVPVKAVYSPGKINETYYRQTGKIDRFPDTLKVTFSETVNFISTDNIFKFNLGDGYDLVLRLIPPAEYGNKNDRNIAWFEVKEKIGGEPSDGDSLCVRPDKIKDAKGVEQKNYTRYVKIEVDPIPYLLIVTPIAPVSVGKEQVVVVVDFLTKIPSGQIPNVDVNGKIIDVTGNLVANVEGLNKNKTKGAYTKLTDKGDTDKILVMWDGKNRAGRDVGAGSYLVILNVTGPDKKQNGETATIGVKSVGK